MNAFGTARCLTAIGWASLMACSDVAEPTHPRGNVAIDVSAVVTNYRIVAEPGGWPYAECDVELTARASGYGTATWEASRDRWYWGFQRNDALDSLAIPSADLLGAWGSDSISAGQVQVASWTMYGPYPFELELAFFVRSSGTAVSTQGTTRLICGPTPPAVAPPVPSITRADLVPPSRPREPGDSLQMMLAATNAGGLWVTQVRASGPFAWDTSFAEQMQPSLARDVKTRIPVGTDLGVASQVWFYAVDQFARYGWAVREVEGLVDRTPPTLFLDFNFGRSTPGGVYFVGETAQARVHARDNHRVSAITWYATPSGPRDSIVGAAPQVGSDSALIAFGPEWLTTDGMAFFARDASGNESARIVSTPGEFRVAPTINRPWWYASVAGSIFDFVIDTLRDAVYLSQMNESRVAFFSMTSRKVTNTVALRTPGMDLSLDGNTLLAAAGNALASVDLRVAQPSISLLPLVALDTALHQSASNVRAIGNGKVFLTLGGTWPNGYRIYEVDPASGEQRVRTDGAEGAFAMGPMERSIDRSTLVVSRANCDQRYDSGTDTFGACAAIIPKTLPPLPDETGQLFLLGVNVYDSNLSYLRTVRSAHDLTGGTPLSVFDANGEFVYHYIYPQGILRSRVSDGFLLDRIPWTTFMPTAMKLSPDGEKLILIENHYSATSFIGVIDLTSPP